MTKELLPALLEESLKVSQKQNRRSYARVVERILTLSERQPPFAQGYGGAGPFDYDPSDPLKNLGKDYLRLAYLLVQAQRDKGNGEAREQIKNVTESLVINGIKFHLNFFAKRKSKERKRRYIFRPNLLGVVEKRAFKRLISEMKSTFAAKNADYGNAFRFWGIPGLVVRIGDKYLRLTQLTHKGYKRKIEEEKVPDTALDLANYGIMLLMILDEGRSLKWGE